MKLSKIILENNKIIHRAELNLSDKDITNLAESIANKLDNYLDIENKTLLETVVEEAIKELIS
tara:strand:+ start:306 stop:494 length:189 start_codon:yes stop_codon:yes gene_type:complete